jgi:ATP-dependent DNA ligase
MAGGAGNAPAAFLLGFSLTRLWHDRASLKTDAPPKSFDPAAPFLHLGSWVIFFAVIVDSRPARSTVIVPNMACPPPNFIEPCLPTVSRFVPTGPQWAYEIKHDGFRFLAVRQRKQVRIYSRGGHDWSERLPGITEAMRTLPVRSVVLDGEGVICGTDGKSDFDRMRACFSRNGAPEA